MAVYCSKCGKKIGILSGKYKSEDGSVVCASCFKKWEDEQEGKKRAERREQEEKNRKIMEDYISPYLANKDIDFLSSILPICCRAYFTHGFTKMCENKYPRKEISDLKENETRSIHLAVLNHAMEERPECVKQIQEFIANYQPYISEPQKDENFDEILEKGLKALAELEAKDEDREDRRPKTINSKTWTYLENERDYYRELKNEADSSKKAGLSSSELDEIGETIKISEKSLDFLDDLEKMYKLFQRKGMEADLYEILGIFRKLTIEELNKNSKELVENIDNDLKPIYEKFSVMFKDNLTKNNIAKEFIKQYHDENNLDFLSLYMSRLFKKFNFTCGVGEVAKLIEQVKEEIELEEFEANIGAPPQEPKIKMGDFTELNGYEFEEYLKNLFKILGYTAVQTSLSGDQGADLILSKDGEKIVVQAKKYEGKVSNKAVQEVAAAKNHYEADKAMIVTNSSFTKSAIELAFSNDVELWDGRKLKSIIMDLESGKR